MINSMTKRTATLNQKNVFFLWACLRFFIPIRLYPLQPVSIVGNSTTLLKCVGRMRQKSLVIITLFFGLTNGLVLNASEVRERMYFEIPSRQVHKALKQLAKQSEHQLLIPHEIVNEQYSSEVKGVYTVAKALTNMLQGTNLSGRITERGVIIVVDADAHNKIDWEKGKMNTKKNILTMVVGSVLSGGIGAQEVASEEGMDWLLEEIVVTATKRSVSAQDIPISISAFDSERLNASGVNDIKDVQFLAAGIHVGGNRNYTAVTVRGIGGDLNLPGTSSGVAVHLDGVYLGQRTQLGRALFDLERIEVLRGPQGTLYGRNATGGSVNILSKSPSDEFEAGLTLAAGNYDLLETEGYISGPLAGDQLQARVAFQNVSRDGYTNDVFAGHSIDNADSSSVRTHLLFEPNDRFQMNLIADYTKDESVPVPVLSRGIESVSTLGELLGGSLASGRNRNGNTRDVQDVEAWGVNLKAEWLFDTFTVNSITAYRETDLFQRYDSDGTEANVIFVDRSVKNTEQVSQEFNVKSNSDGDFEWIVGAYFFSEDDFYEELVPVPPLGFTLAFGVSDLRSTAYAAFSELSYQLTDKLAITAGLRYSLEEKEIAEFSGFVGSIETAELEDDWTSFTPKLSMTYSLSDDQTLYATIGKGFKSGGFNGGVLQGEGFDPEEVTNYEIGFKSILMDGRLRANMAIFRMDYEKLQVQVPKINPLTGLPLLAIDNAAEAVSQGLEIELQAAITERFSLNANLAYLDAEFDSYETVDELRGGASFDLSGNRLPASPEWAFNVGAEYEFDLGDWTGRVRGEYIYQDDTYYTPFEALPSVAELRGQEQYDLFNVRLMFADSEGKWEIASYVKNITDEEVSEYVNIQPVTLGYLKRDFLMPPRTYGVSVSHRF